MPSELRTMSAAVMFFMFAVAVFGIFVGIGVIRRRNWARISILIWGGFMTFVCLAIMAFSMVIFSAGMGVGLPNTVSGDVGHVMAFARIFVVVFYGVPAGVGIWWLVLFTRTRVASAFTNPEAFAQIVDASGFPQPVSPIAAQPIRLACPVPLAILAGFFIFGAVCMVFLFVFSPFSSNVPMFLFGRSFSGISSKSFLLVFGFLSGAAGIGILKLKPWGLYTQIGLQLFGLLNCAATLFSPRYIPAMREMMQRNYSNNPVFSPGSFLLSDAYFRGVMLFSTLMIAVILAILLWQRTRFLELAAEKSA